MLLVHPHGEGSKVTNEELNISFDPTPNYAGIAKEAAAGHAWSGMARNVEELRALLPKAIEAVKGGMAAVLDAHVNAPPGYTHTM